MSARCLTPAGSGGVAVIEVTGSQAQELLRTWCGELPAVGGLRRVHPIHEGQVLDEALLVGRSPGVFELHVHGSPPLVAELLELLRKDSPVNSSVDQPLQRRLQRALAEAPCEAAARVVLDQLEGAWEAELQRLAPLPLAQRRVAVEELALRGEQLVGLFEPRRIVLVGPTNAGKSTLFNALLAHDRALVSGEEGTTRDALVAPGQLGAWPFVLVDTAGERAAPATPQGRVEAAGQALARDWVQAADLVLRLTPASEEFGRSPQASPSVIELWTHADRVPGAEVPAGFTAIAAGASEAEAARARTIVADLVHRRAGLPEQPWQAGAPVPVGSRAIALCRAWIRSENPQRQARWWDLLAR